MNKYIILSLLSLASNFVYSMRRVVNLSAVPLKIISENGSLHSEVVPVNDYKDIFLSEQQEKELYAKCQEQMLKVKVKEQKIIITSLNDDISCR